MIGLYSLSVWIVYSLNQPYKEDYGMLSFQEEITMGDWSEFKFYFYTMVLAGYFVIFLCIYLIRKILKRNES